MAYTAIITAGGTTEAIDDVRLVNVRKLMGGAECSVLTHVDIENISNGGFGRLIAEAFQASGVETTLIGKHSLIRKMKAEGSGLKLVPFRSVEDLDSAIRKELEQTKPDFFLMAAAVSDYTPEKVEGKMSSAEDDLVIRLKKTPKLLDKLRQQVGSDCTLVGFKLVSGLTDQALVEIAKAQTKRARLDFTVGNDFQQIDFANGIHPIKIVNHQGVVKALDGKRSEVTTSLVSHLLRSRSTA